MANDPNYVSNSLLLHCNGPNGSTTVPDTSPTPKTVTCNGATALSTSQSKFSGASLHFDGTNNATVPNSADFSFGTGDFTIETWFYIAANSPANSGNSLRSADLIGFGFQASGNTQYWVLQLDGTTTTTGTGITFEAYNNPTAYDLKITTTVSQGAWHHIAVVRSSGVCAIYLDGSALTLTTNTLTTQTVTGMAGNPLVLGAAPSTGFQSYFNGYLDEVRITKGVARYTSNFSVPTAPFPDGLFQLDGIASTSSFGTMGVLDGFSAGISGLSSTIAEGNIAASPTIALSGNTVTAARGSPAFIFDYFYTLSGQSVELARGTIVPTILADILGRSASTASGLINFLKFATLSGGQIAIANSQFGVTTAITATGISASSAIGIPEFFKFAVISGIPIQAYEGSTVGTLLAPVAGFSATLAKDTVWPAIGLKSATPISTSAGGVFKVGAIVLDGRAIIADTGNAFPKMTRPIIGSQVTSSKGGLQYSADKALLGKSTSPSINPLEFASSDKQSAITGKNITLSAGNLYIGADPWYNFIRVLAVDGAMDSGGSQVVIVLEEVHHDIRVLQLA